MKIKSLITLLSSGLILANSASASIIADEFFNDYGTSDTTLKSLNGGTGWDANGWGETGSPNPNGYDTTYSQGGLTYSDANYDQSGNQTGADDGLVIFNDVDQSTIGRLFDDPESGTIWVSMLAQISDGSVTSGDRTLLWLDAPGANTGTSGGDFIGILDGNISLRTNNGVTGNQTQTGAAASAGTTHLLLAEITVGVGNDSLNFWFDPDLSGGEGGLGVATLSDSGSDFFGDDLTGMALLVAGGGQMDALRVGTTFGDVTAVPEPSTYALLAGFLALGLVMVRRRLR